LITGSDGMLNLGLVKYLKDLGFIGEGIVDKRVWIVKSHYPGNTTKSQFQAKKGILCVRNPLDTIASLFNMTCTASHEKSIHPDDFVRF
jgi:hypothetical protein